MRKVSGVLLAGAMVLSVGMVASPGGAAAAKPTCKTLSGTATFAPPLPKIGATTTTKPTVSIKGADLTGCTGGGAPPGLKTKLRNRDPKSFATKSCQKRTIAYELLWNVDVRSRVQQRTLTEAEASSALRRSAKVGL